jgi:hypothetical protein
MKTTRNLIKKLKPADEARVLFNARPEDLEAERPNLAERSCVGLYLVEVARGLQLLVGLDA